MTDPLPRITIIIPVHNEADELEDLFRKFWGAEVKDRGRVGEVILVENGSTDQTFEACRRLSRKFPGLVKTESIAQASYGAALKKGIESASQDILCLLECDFLDWSFLKESGNLIQSGKADFVVGSKRSPGARDLRPLKRRMLTALFNIGLKIFFRFPGTDTHGLKAIRAEAAKRLCAAAQTGGEVLQTELVLLAHRFGLRVREIPVTVRETRPTKVLIRRRLPKVARIVWELRRSLRRFPREHIDRRTLIQKLFSGRAVVVGMLILVLLFQVAVLTKAQFLYRVAEVVFFVFLAVCLGSLTRLLSRRKALIPVLLFIILLRLPFYLAPEGLITTSDNATEALQCQEIRMTRAVPYFLLEAIRHIQAVHAGVRVIMLSAYTDEQYVVRALRLGAVGYVPKEQSAAELIRAIREAQPEHPFLSRSLADRVNPLLNAGENAGLAPEPDLGKRFMLTRREGQVLDLLMQGKSNREIGEKLGISGRTVEVHRTNLMRKLGLKTRGDLERLIQQGSSPADKGRAASGR